MVDRPEDGRIEFSRSAWNKFLSFSPSPSEVQCVQDELLRIRADSSVGTPVPFGQWKNCYITWPRQWTLIFQRDKSNIYVVDVGKAG